jgi:hypothetical protein
LLEIADEAMRMKALMLATVAGVLLYAPAFAAVDAEERRRPITSATCVFAIYTEDWSYVPQHDSSLIFGLWSDGHVVWSLDQVRGGPPYRGGRVGSRDLRRFFADLEHAGMFDEKKVPRSWVPVDSDFTSILSRWKGRQLLLRSRHELEAETSEEMSADETPEFRHFRDTWENLRKRSALLIPANSVPVQGELVQFHGGITWHERQR